MKSRSAFTIVELLAVIAIVLVLAAIMIPVLSSVRSKAHNTQCVSNLRQVHAGIMSYVNDHGGYFPAVNMRPVSGGAWVQWWRLVQPYMGVDGIDGFRAYKVQQCPEVVAIGHDVLTAAQDSDLLPNYGLNYRLGLLGDGAGIRGREVSVASVRDPANTLLAGDNGMGISSPQAELNPDKVTWQGDKHDSGSNFVWVDGHVSSWKDVTRLNEEPYKPGGEQDVWTP